MKNSNRIDVPSDELLFIPPHARTVVFKEIYEGYKKRFGMKLLYASLNYDEEIMVDYLVIYKVRNDANTADIIYFDAPPIYSDRSTPAYYYYRKNKKRSRFFKFGFEEMVVMDRVKFYEYLQQRLFLSINPQDPNYWKKPESSGELMKGLLSISLYNVRKKPIEIEEESRNFLD